MRTGWAQRPHEFVVLQEIRKMWQVTSTHSFEGQGGKFKPYTPFNRKPVELFKKFTWRQLRRTRMLVHDNPSRCMLDSLEASNVFKRSAIITLLVDSWWHSIECFCFVALELTEERWKITEVKETCPDMASMGNRASSTANSNLVRSLQGYRVTRIVICL